MHLINHFVYTEWNHASVLRIAFCDLCTSIIYIKWFCCRHKRIVWLVCLLTTYMLFWSISGCQGSSHNPSTHRIEITRKKNLFFNFPPHFFKHVTIYAMLAVNANFRASIVLILVKTSHFWKVHVNVVAMYGVGKRLHCWKGLYLNLLTFRA